MFRIADPDAAYPYRLKVMVPTAEGPRPHECTVRFRVISRSEIEALAREGDGPLGVEVLCGWSDIEDVDGAPLEYSPEAAARLLDIPYFAAAVGAGYVRWLAGLPEGNSAAPRAIS